MQTCAKNTPVLLCCSPSDLFLAAPTRSPNLYRMASPTMLTTPSKGKGNTRVSSCAKSTGVFMYLSDTCKKVPAPPAPLGYINNNCIAASTACACCALSQNTAHLQWVLQTTRSIRCAFRHHTLAGRCNYAVFYPQYT